MSKRVLVVDDEEDMRSFFSSILREQGFDVLLAADGDEGLKKIKDEKPDLVVLDIMMPKRGGISVLIEMRKDPAVRKTPVIMLGAIQNFITHAHEEMDDVTSLRGIETLLGDPESKVSRFFLKFRTFRKILLVDREALVEKFRKQDMGGAPALPNMFMDKPIDPDAFSQAVSHLLSPGRET
ncbi:MAG: response regulator transcription factor [Nitrospinota bacterium]